MKKAQAVNICKRSDKLDQGAVGAQFICCISHWNIKVPLIKSDGKKKHENIKAVVSDSAVQPSKVGLRSAGCVS